ncbi:nucleotidyltransferase domain-containing protein [Vallitalea pronyensis]|uniref:Nucleotidyltransferase domain-containing protein n=1 Tax=Vallitalea pronyensis TaxID=1348613 RepID=A0A8J8MG50_9FIRM|nr:nucleotidyltransferase domain-containing protein [Vallitalea pronyensis]QUI20851.1 nucleotidyltransferase domain-containing protein [Vallitalea pronyensis]
MYKHHEETVKKMLEHLKTNEDILGILLTGSIAHGFETPESDVDIMIITTEADYKQKVERGEVTYWNNDICTYDDGYVDGKYISVSFMEKVAEMGSEPARFAFDGAVILYSKIKNLQGLIQKITQYPVEKKESNIKRFYAQFEAWRWYSYEAFKHDNAYLLNHAVSNLILFGGRLILAYNEVLYPYHKWFLRILNEVKEKPENIMALIDELLTHKNQETIDGFYECIRDFTEWDESGFNASQFVMDSELNWMTGHTPVSDI